MLNSRIPAIRCDLEQDQNPYKATWYLGGEREHSLQGVSSQLLRHRFTSNTAECTAQETSVGCDLVLSSDNQNSYKGAWLEAGGRSINRWVERVGNVDSHWQRGRMGR